jgi:hypothetical protein
VNCRNQQNLHKKVITELKAKHMQKLQPELRPPEFPEHLWQYVFDAQKSKVGARFDILRSQKAYDTEQLMENRTEDSDPIDVTKLPKTRLEEILVRLTKIDISTESPARLAEKDIILAQALANIDRFGHPNPNQPAKANGDIFTINLVDKLLPPCFRKSKRLANMAYWSLRRRIEYMLLRGEIRESNSPWNSPPMMVPQADKIQIFMNKHGDKAMDRLAMAEYSEEVRVLYRFTSDLRCVNERTILEIHPLPLISVLLDWTRGSSRYSGYDIEDAFFTVIVDILSSTYTAFSAVDGHYEYVVMPQGARNAANHFARMVENAFGIYKNTTKTIY